MVLQTLWDIKGFQLHFTGVKRDSYFPTADRINPYHHDKKSCFGSGSINHPAALCAKECWMPTNMPLWDENTSQTHGVCPATPFLSHSESYNLSFHPRRGRNHGGLIKATRRGRGTDTFCTGLIRITKLPETTIRTELGALAGRQNLTCVADSFTLDFPGRARALFHVAEVYSAPGLSVVIIAEVCGFIALFWKADVKDGKRKGWNLSGGDTSAQQTLNSTSLVIITVIIAARSPLKTCDELLKASALVARAA